MKMETENRIQSEVQNQWYILNDNQPEGPFTPDQIINKKQNKLLHDHDYLWSSDLGVWTRLFYIDNFKKVTPQTQGAYMRVHPRYEVNFKCYLTQGPHAHHGHVISLSAGGALLSISNSYIRLNQQATLLVTSNNSEQASFVKNGIISYSEFLPHKVQFKSRKHYILTFASEDYEVVKNFDKSI